MYFIHESKFTGFTSTRVSFLPRPNSPGAGCSHFLIVPSPRRGGLDRKRAPSTRLLDSEPGDVNLLYTPRHLRSDCDRSRPRLPNVQVPDGHVPGGPVEAWAHLRW